MDCWPIWENYECMPCDILNPFINITSNPKQFSIAYLDQIKGLPLLPIGLSLELWEINVIKSTY